MEFERNPIIILSNEHITCIDDCMETVSVCWLGTFKNTFKVWKEIGGKEVLSQYHRLNLN